MRAISLGLSAAVLLMVGAAQAAPIITDHGASTVIETQDGREAWRVQGRHHYLFDDESQPSTTGSAASDARACASEPVRVRRADGSTVLRRFKRCD